MQGSGVTTTQSSTVRRAAPWAVGLLILAGLVALAATADGGTPDPTVVTGESRTTVVVNASIIVFREGLEAVLIFAAVTASFLGSDRAKRRPVAVGAGVAFLACIATWFAFQAFLHSFSAAHGAEVQAITGLVAVLVLLVILNWFLHRVYWTGWISRQHKKRRAILGGGPQQGVLLGLVALGFTSVYREGFEIVLFLQSLQLQAGSTAVLEGVALGLTGTAAVGVFTFRLQRKLPYKKMLIVTGVLIAFVLVVMVGGTARSFQDLGWLPGTESDLGVAFPGWLARWFEIVPSWETLGVQVGAVALVLGSYIVAEHVMVRRPKRTGGRPATVASEVPEAVATAEVPEAVAA